MSPNSSLTDIAHSGAKETRLRALYHQIERLQQRLERLQRASHHYAWLRLLIFLVGVAASGAALYFAARWLFGFSLAISLLLFSLAVYVHRRIDRSIARYTAWRQIKLGQIARMTLDWEHIPVLSWTQPHYEHPFEADLNLVGERSLHRLLDTTVSHEASQRLREWLTSPTLELQQIVQRQQLVRELIPLSLFRDKLVLHAYIGANTRRIWDARRLLSWLEGDSPIKPLRRWLFLFGAFASLNLILFALNRWGVTPPVWQITFPLYIGLFLLTARLTGESFDEALALQETLQQLSAIFSHLEQFSYDNTPYLKTLCQPFLDRTQHPSRYLAHLTRLVAALGLRGNPYLWFALNAVIPWDLYFVYRLNQAKAGLARSAPGWLEAWFELETLSALANLAYLNPDYTIPVIINGQDSQPASVFQARDVGHPLIPDLKRVGNDFDMAALGEIAMITGSNMAGKSTFLRTVGLNLALAYAGGPVNARYLQTSLFRLFTCIQVTDSVTDGISYFYAEVKRLKALLSALEDKHHLPLFFFIDEIFRGTNNRERFIGSQAYIQALVGKYGVGLISTHDLELAKLAERLSQVKNYHFRDDFVEGRMVFDYTLRPGPCPTTNALKIMELEGLPVQAT